MKVSVYELTGAALDYAVATANGWVICDSEKGTKNLYYRLPDLSVRIRELYHPSASWAQGGPIIEREAIAVLRMDEHYILPDDQQHAGGRILWGCRPGNVWQAYCGGVELYQGDLRAVHEAEGPTPLIAAMRCFVASKLGDKVDVPDELLPPK